MKQEIEECTKENPGRRKYDGFEVGSFGQRTKDDDRWHGYIDATVVKHEEDIIDIKSSLDYKSVKLNALDLKNTELHNKIDTVSSKIEDLTKIVMQNVVDNQKLFKFIQIGTGFVVATSFFIFLMEKAPGFLKLFS